ALAIGSPVEKVYVGLECSNVEYEREMEKVLLKYKAKGVQKVIFGDIFLEDLRVYRENNLSKIGMKGVFPLWKQDTKLLINEFISSGFEAIICCTDNKFFTSNIVGRFLDNDFIKNLPSDVDPCGENGEFHTFTFNGPIFKEKITFNIGEKLYKQISNDYDAKGFWYCDLY
ncbi:MAG: ATP-binding protein, partial [Spirochaetota bacterium]|nr:ATP-binding protein [Spirochaetota bacterium]